MFVYTYIYIYIWVRARGPPVMGPPLLPCGPVAGEVLVCCGKRVCARVSRCIVAFGREIGSQRGTRIGGRPFFSMALELEITPVRASGSQDA